MAFISTLSLAFQLPSLSSAIGPLVEAVRNDANEALALYPDYSPDVAFLVDVESLARAAEVAGAPTVDPEVAARALPTGSQVLSLAQATEQLPWKGGGRQSRIKGGAIAVAVDSVAREGSGYDLYLSYYRSHEGERAPGRWSIEVRRLRLRLELTEGAWMVTEKTLMSRS